MKYFYKSILILTDNQKVVENFKKILSKKFKNNPELKFSFAQSPDSYLKTSFIENIPIVNIKEEINNLIKKYDLIISAHCQQIFPEELIKQVKCINIHPGFNPFNRGWYPHIFSIINKLPAGATIHEIDKFIDHGPIIIQKQVKINSTDTSDNVYKKIISLETKLFSKVIKKILLNKYKKFIPEEGNINYKKDFDKLKFIDINKTYTGKEFIDLLRSLTHKNHKNAYFFDENNCKIFLEVKLYKE